MPIEAADIIAEVRTTDDLLDAWRSRKVQLGLSDLFLEELSGTHAARVLARTKGVSQLGFGCITSALAIKYIAVHDAEQAAVMRDRWELRAESHVRDRTMRAPLPKGEQLRLSRAVDNLRETARYIERVMAERLVA